MDFTKLASEVVVFLTPFLPYLVLTGQGGAKKIGEKVGEAAWSQAVQIWDRIKSVTSNNAEIDKCAVVIAREPNQEAQIKLAIALVRDFERWPHFAIDIDNMLKNSKPVQMVMIKDHSIVEDVFQKMTALSGYQSIRIVQSTAGNITQEQ